MVRVSLRLSDEARRGLDRAATSSGVTLTAMVEAFGRLLDADPSLLLDEAVALARRIDFDRRSRR